MNRVFILTISDRSYRKEREDLTGPKLIESIKESGFALSGYEILADERDGIREKLEEICDSNLADLVLTAGGTGFAERDVTPEATLDAAERLAPGIAEKIRFESLKKTQYAPLSRGVAAIRKKTLIINLPGSPRGADESFKAVSDILGHGLALLKGEKPDG